MKKIVLAVTAALMLWGCAADVAVTTATAAETKKKQVEEAEKTKKKVNEDVQKSLDALEQRKKQMEQ